MEHALLNSPAVISLLTLSLVMLLEHLVAIPDKYHPLSLFKVLATRMATKVQKPHKNSIAQQKLSGLLAAVILVIPLCALLAIFTQLAEYPYFFDALILLVALQYSPQLRMLKRCHKALALDKKQLAREQLQPFVLRDTAPLSAIGIAKGAIESTLLRFLYQYGAVLFYYCLLGATGALAYRLLFEIQQAWNTKLVKFNAFGYCPKLVVRALQWIPNRIFGLIFAMSNHPVAAFQAVKSASKTQKNLALLGGAMQIEVGGPAFYNGEKVRTQKVGSGRQVVLADLNRCVLAVLFSKLMTVVLLSMFYLVLYLVTDRL